ncbi:hypothetical protein MLD38_021358 [Melastoma candidum]|uniref:Uncharacterized protein n=1 Tax=Melastoma candidum TaxID=119954 RepID=A0ACB9QFR0_9MYRT|nr:hypothetical protein MLD38_021358 [Melastoma candidum]
MEGVRCCSSSSSHNHPNSHNDKNVDPRVIHARNLRTCPNFVDRFFHHRIISLYSFNSKPEPNSHSSYIHRSFSLIPSPNLVSWTSLISSLSGSYLSLLHFLSMLRTTSLLPNHRTLASLLRTCTSLLAFPFGLSLHAFSFKLSLSEDPFVGSSLISFYAKQGSPEDSLRVFYQMSERQWDAVCCSAAVVALAQCYRPDDAMDVLVRMRASGFKPTTQSLSGALRAAAGMAALEQCRVIHGCALVGGLDRFAVVCCALVNGYGKAGAAREARRVFDENADIMNTGLWNAMMSAYAQLGEVGPAIEIFHAMESKGMVPDEFSFLAILSACANAGSVVDTECWLMQMRNVYGLEPSLEHYTCLIRVMGYVGRFEDAKRIVREMQFEPDAAIWRSLLMACGHHGKADMARTMADRILALDPNDESAYVILARIYSCARRWDEVAEVRKMMRDRGVKKEGGRSWIEVQHEVHVFMAGDKMHERIQEIYAKLSELLGKVKNLGHVPGWKEASLDSDKEIEEAMGYHSEMLALAFGLLDGVTPAGKTLRIVKNLRICMDCHMVFKYISRTVQREILVRDVNRYHLFQDGTCSCGDIW